MTALPAVILDCDGLLVDTSSAWSAAITAVFPGAANHPAGASVGQLVALHVNGSVVDRDLLAGRLTKELVLAVAKLAQPMPGAAALLDRVRARPHAIASNAPVEVVRESLAHIGAAAAGVEIVSLAPPFRPKPAPDLHLEACNRIAAAPSESIAFEDSIIGATAACTAGLWVIGVGAEPGLSDHVDIFLDDLEDPSIDALLHSRP